ncbi:MAG: EamA family transporter [Candidatus Woesearchaeota archaeon]|nr:MAG: EamA family transporter [Candidatus Woesearchaeota archaeon]
MVWFIFALLTALFASLKDLFSKKGLDKIDEYVLAFSLRTFALLFTLPLLFFIEIPKLGSQFWIALVVGGSLNIVTTILYLKALKASDMSISVPMITFTPLFLLIMSPILVGEFPSFFGIIGILFIVFGAYILKIRETSEGYLTPFKALLKEKGPRYMLIVAFIWSITSNFDKIGILNSSSNFWNISIQFFIVVFMFPILLLKSPDKAYQVPNNLRAIVPLGIFVCLMRIFQMIAIRLSLVAYVISIKRTSAVMTVLFGCLILKEKGIKERLTGVVLMIIGVLFILLF